MNEERDQIEDIWYQPSNCLLGVEQDESLLARLRSEGSLNHCSVSFPRLLPDPREVTFCTVTNELGTVTSVDKPFCYRTHIGNAHGRPVVDPEVFAYPVPLVDLSTSNPTSREIAEYRISGRTVFDAPVATATEQGQRDRQDTLGVPWSHLVGFQPVEIAAEARIISEARYSREFGSHCETPLEVRAERCRISKDVSKFYCTSELINSEAISRGLPGCSTEEECVQNPSLCVCCFRRIIVVRLADKSDLPEDSERLGHLYTHLDRCVRHLCPPSRENCFVPDFSRLNLEPSSEAPFTQPFNPVLNEEEKEVYRRSMGLNEG